MKITRSSNATSKGPADWFTGDVMSTRKVASGHF